MDGSEQGQRLVDVLRATEQKHPVKFYFLTGWIDNIFVEQSFKGKSIRELLDVSFGGTDLSYVVMNEHAIVIVKDPTAAMKRADMINNAIRERKTINRMTFGEPAKATARKTQRVTFRGRLTDKETGNALTGASVIVSGGGQDQAGTTTNGNGDFSITVAPGEHVVSFSYVNYEEQVIDLHIYEDATLAVPMEEIPTLLDEVIISDIANRENTTARIGQTKIGVREIKRAPALFGEVDLVKQIQILPGVTTAGEAASGFNVRGGGVDQNLVLYDGTPVFNSSHAFGFFSAFNSEAIRDVSFYRGGIPAEYGGRISSVLDIRAKEGDYEKWSFGGGIGLISSNVMVNGPIQKGKSAVAFSARSTYSNWLINTIHTNYADLGNASVAFYDGTLKLAHRFTNSTKLTLSAYSSSDQFRLTGDSTYRWRNLLGSIRLDHQRSEVFSMSFTAGSGLYSYEVFETDPATAFNLSYRLAYPYLNADFHYQRGIHRFTFGIQNTMYRFDPGTFKAASDVSNVKEIVIDRQRSLESALYLSDNILINEKLSAEAGVRLSMFNALGPANINVYRDGEPITPASRTDTIQYGKGNIYKTYFGFEPRLSLRYSFTPTFSVKAGYNRMYQYMHLVSNTTAITPVDIWQPSGYYFKPQLADQVSFGVFKDFKDKKYEAFVEVYYKTIANILDFKDGARLILNPQLETDLLQGNGLAYGVETSVSKSIGRWTGNANYTWSRSLRQIQGATIEESVNEGRVYPSNFDQPHTVNMNFRYGITRRHHFTGNFTYRTGRPVTVPLSGFIIENIAVANFSDRNQYRIPDYHRLDLALIVEGNHKRKKILDGTWAFSIYNVYARKNAYTVFFKDLGNGVLRPHKLAVIGAAIPSISYNFKF
jgi:hypothetical protein